MKRRPRKSSRRLKVIRLWTYAEVIRALPYLRSVTNSLRDHYLEAQRLSLASRRLADKKPNRDNLVALQESQTEETKALDQFYDALRELRRIDIFPLDPVRGLALIPFQKGENLAWFVFDLFEETNLVGWRFHQDAMETRRPIPEATEIINPASIGPANL